MAEIGINLRADPSQFESGTKAAQKAMDDWVKASEDGAADVADKLEEVLRTVVKLGTQTGKTKDEMVRDLRNFGLSAEQAEDAVEAVWEEMNEGRRAAREVEKAADSFEDVEDKADDAADATKRVGDESDKVGSRVSELGDIARDVLEGDFAGAAEGAIGALAGLGAFAGVGGALAGLLAAGAASIVGDWVAAWQKGNEEAIQATNDWADRFIESGGRVLTEELILQESRRILVEDTEKLAAATSLAAAANVEQSTAIRALAGDTQATLDVEAGLNASREQVAANATAAADAQRDLSAAERDALSELASGVAVWNEHTGAVDGGIARMQTWSEVLAASGDTADTAMGKIDGVSLALNSMPPGKTVVVDADTSNFFAQMEAIRRARYSTSVGIDVVINERRGRQVI